jgi:hypothetical protein
MCCAVCCAMCCATYYAWARALPQGLSPFGHPSRTRHGTDAGDAPLAPLAPRPRSCHLNPATPTPHDTALALGRVPAPAGPAEPWGADPGPGLGPHPSSARPVPRALTGQDWAASARLRPSSWGGERSARHPALVAALASPHLRAPPVGPLPPVRRGSPTPPLVVAALPHHESWWALRRCLPLVRALRLPGIIALRLRLHHRPAAARHHCGAAAASPPAQQWQPQGSCCSGPGQRRSLPAPREMGAPGRRRGQWRASRCL